MGLVVRYHIIHYGADDIGQEIPDSPHTTQQYADDAARKYEREHPGIGGAFLTERRLEEPAA